MAFAILRLNKLKTFGNIGGLSAHIERTMDCPNADKSLQHLNQKFVGTGNLCADVQTRIESAGVKPQTDSVLAVEFLMSASPDYFKEGFSGSRKFSSVTINDLNINYIYQGNRSLEKSDIGVKIMPSYNVGLSYNVGNVLDEYLNFNINFFIIRYVN